jgi:hypothetical protein
VNEFSILNTRKRALIALIHSVVFFGIALHGFASHRAGISLHGSGLVPGIAMLAIYSIVSSVLLWLVTISGCAMERIYFGFCASSASCGLLRIIFGDATLPVAQYLRVLMLTCAVITGIRIYRGFSEEIPSLDAAKES